MGVPAIKQVAQLSLPLWANLTSLVQRTNFTAEQLYFSVKRKLHLLAPENKSVTHYTFRSKKCEKEHEQKCSHSSDFSKGNISPCASSLSKPPRDPSLRSRMTTGRRREGSRREINPLYGRHSFLLTTHIGT